MKRIFVFTVILCFSIILCSCDYGTTGSYSSEISDISVPEESDNKNAIIVHETLVFGGEELSQLEKDGIIPDLKIFGINSDDFKYVGEYLQRVGIGSEWLDQPGSKLYQHWYKYENSEGDVLAIDKEGRLRRYFADYSKAEVEIPNENILSDEQLTEKATQLAEQFLADGGDFKEYTADPPRKDSYTQELKVVFVDNITDCVGNYLSVSLLPDGRIFQLSSDYKDLSPEFSYESFDDFADEWLAENLPKRYSDLSEYEVSSKLFYVVDGIIYGEYTYSYEVGEGGIGCEGIIFKEPKRT